MMHNCASNKHHYKKPLFTGIIPGGKAFFTLLLLLCFKLLKSLNGGSGRRGAFYSESDMKNIFKLGHQGIFYYGIQLSLK